MKQLRVAVVVLNVVLMEGQHSTTLALINSLFKSIVHFHTINTFS